MTEVLTELTEQEMVDWANANLEKVRELEAEIERLKADYDECYQDLVDETLRANAAEERIDKLQAVVTRYAEHDAGCTCEDLMDSGDIFYRGDWSCSCGYREALAAVEEADDEIERLRAENARLESKKKRLEDVVKKMGGAIWDAYEPGCDCPTCALAEILNEIEEEE